MRYPSLASLLVAAPLALLACAHSPSLQSLTVDQVASRITANDGSTFIYDDNPHDRFVKGHLPGAKWVSGATPTAADLPADKNATLVFYCASEL